MKLGRRFWNLATLAGVCLLLGLGVFAAGKIRGFFGAAEDGAAFCAEKVQGEVRLLRAQTAFALQEESALTAGDRIETGRGAQVRLVRGEDKAVLGENGELTVEDEGLLLAAGELWVETEASLALQSPLGAIVSEDAVYAVSTGEASCLLVFAGEVTVDGQAVFAGQQFVSAECGAAPLSVESISSFALECALTGDRALCLSAQELAAVQDARREAERESLAAVLAETKEETAETPETVPTASESAQTAPAAEDGLAQSLPQTASEAQSTASFAQSAAGESQPQSTAAAQTAAPEQTTEAALRCTVEVRCDTILRNMDALAPEKQGFVPADGEILQRVEVSFSQGESAYAVLQRALAAAGIPLEAAYTPFDGSYYIEGINNLYEFDCGSESGWVYRVNGQTPGVACSSYVLQNGDTVLFAYTCSGLGADLN